MEIANVEQAAAWDGDEGEAWAADADRFDHVARRHLARLVGPDVVGPADRILDVGCGNGASSLAAARLASAGSVLGLDLSGPMLAVARRRAAEAGLTNVEFARADVQVHRFAPAGADLVLSGFGGMFFGDPMAAYRNLAGALRPGGRLRMLAWRDLAENEWITSIREALALGRELGTPPPDAPSPFSLADPARVRRLLTEAGFVDVELAAADEPMEWGDDPDHAFAFVRTVGIVNGLLDGLDEEQRAAGLANLHQVLVDHATPDGVLVRSAAWRISATRA
jgi:SAM-dependent methyltransferase